MTSELEFALEPYTRKLRDEIEPLAQAHAAEVLQPGYKITFPHASCIQLASLGKARCFTARSNGQLIGYNGFLLVGELNKESIIAEQVALFIKHDFRKFFNAMKFLRWCDEQLIKDGVNFVNQHVTEAVDYSPLLRRLGYNKTETIYRKQLWATP